MFRNRLNNASPTDGIEDVMLALEKTGKGLAISTVAHTPIDVFGRLEYAFEFATITTE
jgi:hypothetical protein